MILNGVISYNLVSDTINGVIVDIYYVKYVFKALSYDKGTKLSPSGQC
jgi:uncharacterized membrane protein